MESIVCLVNITVLVETLTRRRLEFQNGATEALSSLFTLSTLIRSRGTKLESTRNSIGLTTRKDEDLLAASVVMLSNVSKYGTPNSSIQQLMKSYSHLHNVHSILLQFFPFKAKTCKHGECNCIVFWADEEMTTMLARRMPGILKRLTDPLCLLPCLTCLTNGCHECREGLLPVESPLPVERSDDGLRLRESDSKVVSKILDKIRAGFIRPGETICISIPMNDTDHDDGTNILVRSLRSKYPEGGGAKVMAWDVLQGCVAGYRGLKEVNVGQYSACSIVSRLIEILINLALTFWFRVDAFSSSLIARSIIRDHLRDSQERVLAVNAHEYYFRQAFTFGVNRLSLIAGGVNLICFISRAVFIAFEGGHRFPPLSIPRVTVIITAICIALVMDCFYFFSKKRDCKLLIVIILEIICIIAVSVVATTLVSYSFRKWVYNAVQALVWVKWGMGSYILDKNLRDNSGVLERDNSGKLVLSSAFLLNVASIGVGSNWRAYWAYYS